MERAEVIDLAGFAAILITRRRWRTQEGDADLVWELALAAALVWLGHHRRIRPGGLFALYVAGYSLFRISEELLRVDPAHHILGLRLNFFVARVLFAGGLGVFARLQCRGTASV